MTMRPRPALHSYAAARDLLQCARFYVLLEAARTHHISRDLLAALGVLSVEASELALLECSRPAVA